VPPAGIHGERIPGAARPAASLDKAKDFRYRDGVNTPPFIPEILLAAAALLLPPAGSPQESRPAPNADPVVGLWEGKLDLGSLAIRLAIHVHADGGKYGAELDSLDQGTLGIPVDDFAFAGGKLGFKVRSIGASYTGALSKDGNSIEGTFVQGREFPLTFRRVAKVSELVRPQTPKPPFPYRDVAVAFSHEPGKPTRESFLASAAKDDTKRVTLSGTLTLPAGTGPFPAAVLVTGSGPQNRDEELLGHRPFLVLADHLARHGIAVLRVDDRGVGESTGKFDTATTRDFADDAEAGVLFLASRPEISHKKIGIIGHSEGGVVAPMVAARSENVGFAVLLAGTGVDGAEILRLQERRIAELMGADPQALEKIDPLRTRLLALAREEGDTKEMLDEMRSLLTKIRAIASPKEATQGDAASRANADAAVETELRTLRSPWFRAFLALDPSIALRKVRCPVLALNGERDCQVIPTQNLPEIARALSAGGNPDWAVVELPGLNHLFQECATGSPTEYAQIEQTFSPRALTLLSDWILAHTH
jgi:pimeloyl-ACP methyl ester carboxylesterase